MMPGKDCIETLRDLKAMSGSPNETTPVICLTANAISGARASYLHEGFRDYLSKPIDPDRLEEMMIEYLPKEKTEKSATDEIKDVKNDLFSSLTSQGLIDTEAGLKHCGDEEVYGEVLKSFFESMDETKRALNGFAESGDLKNYEILIHSVKSTAKTIGALSLGDSAKELELAAKNGDAELVRKKHAPFMDDFEMIRGILESFVEDPRLSR
jgi:response regulator RpfG family c-di-GMP phosphodiesterase